LLTFNTLLEMHSTHAAGKTRPTASGFQYSIRDAEERGVRGGEGRQGGFQYSIRDASLRTGRLCVFAGLGLSILY